MKDKGYVAPWEIWNDFVKNQMAKDGWKIKAIDYENLCGDFYYTKPLTYLEKLRKKPENKTIVIHADLDPEADGWPITLSKGK